MEDSLEVNHKKRIGKRIAELRKERGLSQAKLAQLTGLNSGYIARVELGTFDIGIENLSKIGDVLGMEIDFVEGKPGSCC